ncbi:Hypothetical predicted protein [Octopus vulgaris]|uniref:Mif2/CENP-C cupin domain-containing protein n=1 Tax=Octopus vulgaris TaxID=6645 RepID=A0AA36FCJ7_OCTVU|nr:Hypothetical predicted protein [Octopus vulgaris]
MALSTAQIRTNLGKGILEGKRIRIDEDGFENFDDYFTETDSDDSDVEIVNHADNVKIVAVKPAADDDAKSSVSPLSLSNFPSRKRLSFPVESMTDSCSNASEEVSYVQRVISKRGMKSLADTSAADSEDGDHQEVIVSEKEVTTAKTPEVSSAASNSNSNVRIISKRGMKSFPEDEESFVQKAASSPAKESLSTNVCDPSAEEPETTVKNGGNTSLSSSKECQENEDDEENEDDLENDNIKNEDVLPEAVSTRKKRKMTVSESFSASPEKIKESPRKMISAFGVHKPTVQTRYFDVFDTNLSLIEENEKTFKKSTKIVKKPESGGRSAEKNKDVPSDVPKDKSSPLRHKKPQPSPTAKQTLKSKSVPQDKSSPSRYKKPPTTSPEKQTLRNKSEAKDKTPPSRHKRPQPPLAAKHTLKSKIPSGVLKDKSSPLRHKKLRPSPIAKSTLKTKTFSEIAMKCISGVPSGLPENKSSPSKHKMSQPSPTAKQTSKSKSVPSDVPEDKSSPQRHKKTQPSSTEKHTVRSKSVPSGVTGDKSSPSRNKRTQTPPTEKQTLKSKNHINTGEYTTRSMRNESLLKVVKPDNNASSCFAPKQTYRYINNKMLDAANEHDIVYCCCLDTEKAFMGMISLKKGAYKQLNRSTNQVMFLVQFGKIKVRIGYKNMILTTGDSFMVPENEIYSLRNKSNHDCGLVVTILK